MKLSNLLFIVICALLSCSQKQMNNLTTSTFVLQKDLYNLSKKMQNGDTMFINAPLGACTSDCRAYNTLFKLNDTMFIKSKIIDMFFTGDSMTLEKMPYVFEKNDTLNFEKLFYNLRENTTKPEWVKSYTFQVIYNRDTLEFYSHNLIHVIQQIEYYKRIMEKIYPNVEFFKPDIVTIMP